MRFTSLCVGFGLVAMVVSAPVAPVVSPTRSFRIKRELPFAVLDSLYLRLVNLLITLIALRSC